MKILSQYINALVHNSPNFIENKMEIKVHSHTNIHSKFYMFCNKNAIDVNEVCEHDYDACLDYIKYVVEQAKLLNFSYVSIWFDKNGIL